MNNEHGEDGGVMNLAESERSSPLSTSSHNNIIDQLTDNISQRNSDKENDLAENNNQRDSDKENEDGYGDDEEEDDERNEEFVPLSLEDEFDIDDGLFDEYGSEDHSNDGAEGSSKTPAVNARAVHNALERRRRDNIKDMFGLLKSKIPDLNCDKTSSRTQILKRCIELIDESSDTVKKLRTECEILERENQGLEAELRELVNGLESDESEHSQDEVSDSGESDIDESSEDENKLEDTDSESS
uniref:BHLH domain-containing protein n=1 Tax=Rhabditophanes sp. KR3021 TaxID=114890 RepID=A0AC35TKQ5_9BILA